MIAARFLAVMFIIVQHEAAAALTAVASKGVHTFMLATSVFFRALVYIRKEMSLEAPLGDSVVRLELNPHVVVLGSDDLRFLCSTELPMKL